MQKNVLKTYPSKNERIGEFRKVIQAKGEIFIQNAILIEIGSKMEKNVLKSAKMLSLFECNPKMTKQ